MKRHTDLTRFDGTSNKAGREDILLSCDDQSDGGMKSMFNFKSKDGIQLQDIDHLSGIDNNTIFGENRTDDGS